MFFGLFPRFIVLFSAYAGEEIATRDDAASSFEAASR